MIIGGLCLLPSFILYFTSIFLSIRGKCDANYKSGLVLAVFLNDSAWMIQPSYIFLGTIYGFTNLEDKISKWMYISAAIIPVLGFASDWLISSKPNYVWMIWVVVIAYGTRLMVKSQEFLITQVEREERKKFIFDKVVKMLL